MTVDQLKDERNKARALARQTTIRINRLLAANGEASDGDYVSLTVFDQVFADGFPRYSYKDEYVTAEQAQRLNGWFKKLELTEERLSALVMMLQHDSYFKASPTRRRVLARLPEYLTQSDSLMNVYYPGEEL